MYGHTTGSSADFTSKNRPLRIAGQLVGPFTTGWGVARPAVPIGSRIATDGSVKRTVAAVDARDEQAGGEVLVLARRLRDGLGLRVAYRDRALLPDRATARRVLRERGIGVKLLHGSVGSDRVSVREIGLRREQVEPLDRKRVLGRFVDDPNELVKLANARESDGRVARDR